MKAKERLKQALPIIRNSVPNIPTELDYETPFQFLIAVMLSAQTTDKQVNKTTPPLFDRVKNPADLLSIPFAEFEGMVSSVNYYRMKAKHAYATAKLLEDLHGGGIPNTLDALVALPGVGVKTAKVVLAVLYGEAVVAVDTHVHRVLNRIGIVRTKSPIETDRAIETLFSEEEKKESHHPLVLFGRYVCKAQKPQCETCGVRTCCEYFKRLEKGRPKDTDA